MEFDTIKQLLGKTTITQQDSFNLKEWADSKLDHICSGGMIVGLVSIEEARSIHDAYKRSNIDNEVELWRKVVWLRIQNPAIEPDIDAAIGDIDEASKLGVDLRLDFVRIYWFYKRDDATEGERALVFSILQELLDESPEDADLLYLCGLLTAHGFGTESDVQKSIGYLKKAVDRDHPDSAFELFIYYMQGVGVGKSESDALKYLRMAAELEHDRAMYNLGAFYATGQLLPKDEKKAAEWYEKSADRANVNAMIGLATLYAQGLGVDCDLEYARELLDEAEYLGADVEHLRDRFGLDQV